ncbi:hypothetical protein GT204_20845 [Streptomyces sp. SID4919]|uniref:hypothetical protein n=1 Tax=unclassified Streptomyces TaxID=2593676 RepID=UPI000823D0C8|nr:MULTISPECIES: hypothetical protein [unclassified Streptomyces]MYY11289.1 hypothetical protein [Streptomyces sp. SID4919]SCK17238.1 hypothetical protein YW7DRAFT_01187 [Streptomyces sp. AmelKG-E11A]
MAVDPTDPETFEDTQESEQDPRGAADAEAPEADAAEQHAELTPEQDDALPGSDPASAAEGDRAEQARVVALDEDDYR